MYAQIPNFGSTAGDNHLYGYSSIKYRKSPNKWEMYSTLQYGVTDYMNIGADLYSKGSNTFIGYTFRSGVKINSYFSIGAQITPSFNLSANHEFAYMTEAIYINGNITSDGRVFWVTNTWFEQAKHELTSAQQWSYLGYSISFGKDHKRITPMVGFIHDWRFDSDLDLSFGAFYGFKKINVYAWTNDILTRQPRFIIAIEFKFCNK